MHVLLFQIQLQDFQRVRDAQPECQRNGRLPVDLDLKHVLASMPRKVCLLLTGEIDEIEKRRSGFKYNTPIIFLFFCLLYISMHGVIFF